MGFIELLIMAVGLSMDASAVNMANGFSLRKFVFKFAFITSLTFGLMQGLMPLIGYLSGSIFGEFIEKIDHYIALVLLGVIGAQMIKESFSKEVEEVEGLKMKTILSQGIATSIDALAVGVSLAALKVDITQAVYLIGSVTFILSFISFYLGGRFGNVFKNKAQLVGGIILVGIGLKIFIEHMFF